MQDIISEHPERFFIGEIVREKIFIQYKKEVPYACQVRFLSTIYVLKYLAQIYVLSTSLVFKKKKIIEISFEVIVFTALIVSRLML